MKSKGLYIILSLYSISRWGTEYFEDNYDLFDANILYFICDGLIIGLIGLFLYLNSDKDYVSKACLFLMVSLGLLQAYSYLNQYVYLNYIDYLPLFVAGVTVLEIYKNKDKFIKLVNRFKKK